MLKYKWILIILGLFFTLSITSAHAQDTGCVASLAPNFYDHANANYTPIVRGGSVSGRNPVCLTQSSPPATFKIGLYTDGTTYSNDLATVSSAHDSVLRAAASQIVPLDASGNPCTPGGSPSSSCTKGVVTIGFSNSGDENCSENVFTSNTIYPYGTRCSAAGLNTFLLDFNAQQTGVTPLIDPNITIVPGDQGGCTADTWAESIYFNNGVPLSTTLNTTAAPWGNVLGAAANAGNPAVTGALQHTGINAKQIEFVAVKLADVFPWSGGSTSGCNNTDNNTNNGRSHMSALGHTMPFVATDVSSTGISGRTGGIEAAFAEYNAGQIARFVKIAFPNVKIISFYGRMYGGSSTSGPPSINGEPFAYEYQFSVQQLIRSQINQADNSGSADPVGGNLSYSVAPPMVWDYNIWSGEGGGVGNPFANTRSDGLFYCSTITQGCATGISDFQSDHAHPALSGSQKINLGISGSTSGLGTGRLTYYETSAYFAPWVLKNPAGPTPTPTPTLTPTPTPTPLGVMFYAGDLPPSPSPTPTPGSVYLYYLGGLGQTSGFITSTASHGQVGVACRVSWKNIQPLDSTHFTWTALDACQSAAHAAVPPVKWSISFSAGGYTPWWVYSATDVNGRVGPGAAAACTGSGVPATCCTGPGTGACGTGTAIPFSFIWAVNYIFPTGSTQFQPVPWDPNFLSQWKTAIDTVTARYGSDPLLDHVIATGMNYITQENSQTHTPSDTTNWTNLLTSEGFTQANYTDTSSSGLITGSYNTMIQDWGNDVPSTVNVGSMFINGPGFPFILNNSFGLALLNEVIAAYPTRSVLMNNAANVSGGVVVLDPKIKGYASSSKTAYQEGPSSGVGGGASCSTASNITVLINGVQAAGGQFLELYEPDIKCL